VLAGEIFFITSVENIYACLLIYYYDFIVFAFVSRELLLNRRNNLDDSTVAAGLPHVDTLAKQMDTGVIRERERERGRERDLRKKVRNSNKHS
jgi:hypothetical protein